MRAAIGADLGGTKMAVGVVDAERNVLHRSTAPTLHLTRDQLLDGLERELREALAAVPEAGAVGLGLPCTIDRARGLAISAVNLPIVDLPIRDLVSDRLGLPTYVDNDANMAMLAEHRFGAARGARHAVMLTVGTGIGGGAVVEGQLLRGSSGAGAEFGHIVIDENGPKCQGNCPNRGCVEVLGSGTALAIEGRRVAEEHPESALGAVVARDEEVTGRAVTAAALAGDEAAIEAVALIGRRIGVALSSIVNVFEPEMIVVGGGVSAAGELLVGPAREEMRERALPPQNATPVVLAELGPEAGMIGAATMALEESRD